MAPTDKSPLEIENAILRHRLACKIELDHQYENITKALREVTDASLAQQGRLAAGAETFGRHEVRLNRLEEAERKSAYMLIRVTVVLGILAGGGVAGWKVFWGGG